MENIIKKIKKGAKHTRLSLVEKAEIKSVLVRHMKANPVDSSVLNARGIPSHFNINNFRNKKGISILIIGSLLMGGTVSFAAENTVPGDALFTVKLHVNETVRGVVAVTPKAKAEWEVKLVERRLEEVEKLAMTPDALPEIQQVAERNLENYAGRVKTRIEKFDEDEDGEDAVETASRLSKVYNSHEQVLFEMNSNASFVATSTITATVTPVVAKPSVKNEKNNTTLKKVQVARDDAEKKHKELKEKYSKDKVVESAKIESVNKPVKPPKVESSKSRSSNKKPSYNRTEEIRSTVTTAKATSTPSAAETKVESKKEENISREETNARDSKEDDKDND
ncbi:MAG: hypothetical protein UW27_C0017G0078 [Parcubacteria group bacterium GW2011_GWA1_44_13]|uniref:DUF5667 domain-containing protein n=1 Tax=Candidatus Nomurabacteria bacterium GW2011_GWB1_44_12 TaxID=1618748 RepID=A0A837IHV8_9BACT|nr:MAG: hypothetical protein UW25_C0004G0092 [Candidatus Nomurabacteria bacterium GW2011_GWB1_44_12]KKT37461.1 MAG: hypothetical protein UW27_C0017G0078 [Parcubacteria group bacterium GW2011_GWA1_44_13]KKT59384.1 MAG: hypothetical protein UW54_C0027G0006 [Parcubacteria group bacterium GW2011_GWC1_44_26]HBB43880.1 hypothetical protein [Candidatus Yonathbacteria bacterium]